MATKATLAAALLVAMLALATASAYDENWQQCGMLVQVHHFPACQRFLRWMGPSGDQGFLQDCCQELRRMDSQQCTCEAIRRAVIQAQYGLASTGQLYDRARTLPHRCGLRQQQCRFNLIFL